MTENDKQRDVTERDVTERDVTERDVIERDVTETVNRLDPIAGAKLGEFKRGPVDEKQIKAVNDLIDKKALNAKSENTMEDLRDAMREADGAEKQTLEEAVQEINSDPQADRLTQILSEITESNFTDSMYVDYFSYLPFERRLELLKVDKEKAGIACDTLITTGKYEKSLTIRKKLTITISSRTADVSMKALEKMSESSISRVQSMEILALYNCAGSLKKYGDTEFSDYKEVAKEDRAKFLEDKVNFILELPAAIYHLIANETVRLDLLINTVTSEEGLQNL